MEGLRERGSYMEYKANVSISAFTATSCTAAVEFECKHASRQRSGCGNLRLSLDWHATCTMNACSLSHASIAHEDTSFYKQ